MYLRRAATVASLCFKPAHLTSDQMKGIAFAVWMRIWLDRKIYFMASIDRKYPLKWDACYIYTYISCHSIRSSRLKYYGMFEQFDGLHRFSPFLKCTVYMSMFESCDNMQMLMDKTTHDTLLFIKQIQWIVLEEQFSVTTIPYKNCGIWKCAFTMSTELVLTY